MLNGANAHCLSRFTGQDAHAEARARARTYDLVAGIKKRRFVYLGHILRMQGNRLVKHAVERQFVHAQPGNMFHDVPAQSTLPQIKYVVSNRKLWKRLAVTIGRTGAKNKLWPPNPPTLSIPPMLSASATTTTEVHVRPTRATTIPLPQMYRTRDARELFFRPATKPFALERWLKVKKENKSQKEKAETTHVQTESVGGPCPLCHPP